MHLLQSASNGFSRRKKASSNFVFIGLYQQQKKNRYPILPSTVGSMRFFLFVPIKKAVSSVSNVAGIAGVLIVETAKR
jgi:hypothetical protein